MVVTNKWYGIDMYLPDITSLYTGITKCTIKDGFHWSQPDIHTQYCTSSQSAG